MGVGVGCLDSAAMLRSNAMSSHQAGVYPSGWNSVGISLSVYRFPLQTALPVSQWTSFAVAVFLGQGRL